MTKFDNTNRGSIWKNKKKEKATQADFTGSINVDGKEYWLNGWLRKEGASQDSPAMTFSVRPKSGTMPIAKTDGKSVSSRDDMDGDLIPF
jgi:hypothetical protein